MRKNPHAVALGRRGGKVMTEKKLTAIRENGKKGGRRPKFEAGDRVRITDAAPSDYRGGIGTIVRRGPGKAEYEVGNITGADQRRGHLMSWWLVAEPHGA